MTLTDSAIANADGWDVFDCDGSDDPAPFQLQGLDEMPEPAPAWLTDYDDRDRQAWLHVRTLAAEGAPHAQRALALLAEWSPTELVRIATA